MALSGGAGHFFAIRDSAGPDVTFVDPLNGKHVVPRSELKRRYRFTGFFLIVRRG